MLFIVATPIGNLGDITIRALDILKSCDLILCEDTRHTLKLLNHYKIKKPLLSYHKFNEAISLDKIINNLKEQKNIALVSDAGTPLIADPGYKLVERCVQEGIEVTSIPGACAAIDALVLSGFDTQRFQFIGFLPKQQKELQETLQDLTTYDGVTICYESPERIAKTVEALKKISPHLMIAIARELTKKFEEVLRGNVEQVKELLSQKAIKGECILLIQGKPFIQDYNNLSIEEHISQIQTTYSLSRKEAIKMVAEQRGQPKRIIYNQSLKTRSK